jgi:hypothetical protein
MTRNEEENDDGYDDDDDDDNNNNDNKEERWKKETTVSCEFQSRTFTKFGLCYMMDGKACGKIST